MPDKLLLPILLAAALLAACCAPATEGRAPAGAAGGGAAMAGSETAFRATLLERTDDGALVELDDGAPVRLLLTTYPLPDGVRAGDTVYVRGLLQDDGSVRLTSASYRRAT